MGLPFADAPRYNLVVYAGWTIKKKKKKRGERPLTLPYWYLILSGDRFFGKGKGGEREKKGGKGKKRKTGLAEPEGSCLTLCCREVAGEGEKKGKKKKEEEKLLFSFATMLETGALTPIGERKERKEKRGGKKAPVLLASSLVFASMYKEEKRKKGEKGGGKGGGEEGKDTGNLTAWPSNPINRALSDEETGGGEKKKRERG